MEEAKLICESVEKSDEGLFLKRRTGESNKNRQKTKGHALILDLAVERKKAEKIDKKLAKRGLLGAVALAFQRTRRLRHIKVKSYQSFTVFSKLQ